MRIVKRFLKLSNQFAVSLSDMEERLDKILVRLNLVDTRVRAEQIIQETGVKVNGKLVSKPGKKFPIDSKIELVAEELEWISKDALKLEEAIKHWKVKLDHGAFLELGSTSSVFAEVLLKYNANEVFVVNGSKQSLPLQFKNNKKVHDLSDKQLREITKHEIPELVDGCVIDQEGVPLNKILPFVHPFIKEQGFLIAVIKPVLEVGKEHLKNNGSVRNTLAYPEMFESIQEIGKTNNLKFIEFINSPIVGKDGQKEFIVYFRKGNKNL